MSTPASHRWLDVSRDAEEALIGAARDANPVDGLTHNFYRYPARFSPAFARAAIEALSAPGDTVLDPYVGGGTTLVEALAAGRSGIGIDISQLADFVTTVKTTVLSEAELSSLSTWAQSVANAINMHRVSITFPDYEELGYLKHMGDATRWRLRRAIEQALGSALGLKAPKLVAFARCCVLRTAQWALDGRKVLPSVPAFRDKLGEVADEMLVGATALSEAVRSHPKAPTTAVLNRSSIGLDENHIGALSRPSLVVTSPPYPGIHVLYHRWQVDGRKESPAPFWIANKLDGAGSSYYTMGDRKNPTQQVYFESIRAATASVVPLCDADATFVQMVAFARPEEQLPRYLDAMEAAGLTEQFLPSLSSVGDGRLWRTVPNRRWYAQQRGDTPSSKEVVLFHRKAMPLRRPGRSRRPNPRPSLLGPESLE